MLRRPLVLDHRALPALQRDHRLFQHGLIELEADLADMARLLLAEQIAGAADVEVVARQHEAGAERIERLQHLQPLLGGWRQPRVGGHGDIGIGADLGAADAPAQLIELGEPEHVGAMHDQRVGGRNVEAGLDDRGRQQHVVLPVVEGVHHRIELARGHLAVGAGDLQLGHVLLQEGRGVVEIGDARHDIEGLAAAIALAQQRLAQDDGIERRHIGAHRQAIDRRRGDQRHLAHAGERQLQRARDRRRGQRQHMHVLAQLLQPLLVLHAEMLLLVDDQEAEIGELDGLAEQRMGADDDVDVAVA